MIAKLSNAVRRQVASWWKTRAPTRESIVVAAMLAVIFEVCYLSAFFFRGELLFRRSDSQTILSTIWCVVGLKLLVFYVRGLCHRPWRAARFADLNNLLRAATTALLLLIAYNYVGQYVIAGRVPIPRSVLLLDWVFTLLGVGGMQALARSIFEELMPSTPAGKRVILVIDASDQGRQLAMNLGGQPGSEYFVAGLLDDDPLHYGVHVGKARVLGAVAMAPACAERLRASEIVIREGAVYGARLCSLCDACAAINVRVRIAERPVDAVFGGAASRMSARDPRIRDIEIRDLLSRPQANLGDKDAHVLPFIRGKSILVTGAGGSIGSEICRQVMRFEPARLVMLERSEYSLFSIHRELVGQHTGDSTRLVPVLADITNVDRTDRILAEHKPDVIIHAAAFKHVPLMEAHPVEAVENNTLATASLAELADSHGVEAFVALSTDKAVHPSSVMGASKLVAERFLESFGETSRTRFATVRFGNVLGSSGSAVPIFQEQLSRGLPITITHPDVRRYFMTIDEAAQLVLFTGSLVGRGGTYVLEMGESLPIVEVVQRLAFVMNVPSNRVRIEYCGLRPGEKLDEELFFEDESRLVTDNPLVTRVCRATRPLNEVRSWLAELKHACGTDPHAASQTLMGIVSSDCRSLSRVRDAAPPKGADEAPADDAGAAGASVIRERSAASSVNVPA
jgi:FlaA1/EpsC-like NDP-sugar epimerase